MSSLPGAGIRHQFSFIPRLMRFSCKAAAQCTAVRGTQGQQSRGVQWRADRGNRCPRAVPLTCSVQRLSKLRLSPPWLALRVTPWRCMVSGRHPVSISFSWNRERGERLSILKYVTKLS